MQLWMEKIRLLNRSFHQIEAKHIYREYNQVVDQLSKDALPLVDDGIFFAKVLNGHSNSFGRLAVKF